PTPLLIAAPAVVIVLVGGVLGVLALRGGDDSQRLSGVVTAPTERARETVKPAPGTSGLSPTQEPLEAGISECDDDRSKAFVYTVSVRDQALDPIARRFGLEPKDVTACDASLGDGTLIRPGQKFKIPCPAAGPCPPVEGGP